MPSRASPLFVRLFWVRQTKSLNEYVPRCLSICNFRSSTRSAINPIHRCGFTNFGSFSKEKKKLYLAPNNSMTISWHSVLFRRALLILNRKEACGAVSNLVETKTYLIQLRSCVRFGQSVTLFTVVWRNSDTFCSANLSDCTSDSFLEREREKRKTSSEFNFVLISKLSTCSAVERLPFADQNANAWKAILHAPSYLPSGHMHLIYWMSHWKRESGVDTRRMHES